ncbi:serine/threonine-protein kinase TBK1-like isoform X2 [Mercenaria mercenaria]|uniref:serine/threonine-protein kinase TBK1-like isoform X2 n=1 Tax=Mercenaria mercenaria TaxID=6596 RepID=UPI00234F1793|nr:serine/threonine-protein kinase TBK1-like isoform X2 [Mercenaria mercenaria]
MSYKSPGDKTGPLRYTQNYVYNIADCLGKGATASVFLGRERTKGNQVAIKVFPQDESRQIAQARIREAELLKTISHRNVMQLLAYEQELVSGQQAIVLPYCQGGSVHALLEQPENGFGFQETEFLIFLKNITSGLKYLRQKGILHRDIKPGNIMKGIEQDGSSVYILTDFGAARELGEEETFMSIYGTEEYIHPDMFQRAVLRQPGQSQFTSSVDLWSLAVTIYHVATGKLPFQAFGGRNDSHMMFQIISGRRSGDISGIQREPGGPVERSKHLPETCYLSRGLMKQIEPILAGLFETDTRRTLTFDQFFDAVSDVISKKTVKIFFARNATQMMLYLCKTDSYCHIQENIASLTEIPADRQLLLLGHTELKDIIEADEQIYTYPKSIQNAQLFLFEKDNYESMPLLISKLPPFPPCSFNSSLSNDSSVAKKCAAIGYYLEWKTKDVIKSQELLLDAKLHLRLYVENALSPIQRIVPELDKEIYITQKRSDNIKLSQQNVENVLKLVEVLTSGSDNYKELMSVAQPFCSSDSNANEVMAKTRTRYEEIKVYTSVMSQRLSAASTSCPADHFGCNKEDHCLSKVEHIRQGIQTVSSTFSKHKKYGELHPHETFIHTVESILLKHLTRVGKVETNINFVMECQGQVNERLDKIDELYHITSELLQKSIKEILKNPSTISKMARRETQEYTKRNDVASDEHEKSVLMKRLITEVTQLETERTELDTLLNSNTQTLLELKSMLTGRSLTSLQQDKKSVEYTELHSTNHACGFS